MKPYILSLITLVVFGLTSVSAEARTKHGSAPSTTTAAELRSPAGGDSASRFGFGFATYGGGLITGQALAQPSLSGWIDLNHLMSLQILAAINSTNPFSFGFGSVFRYTLHGSQALGFHCGFGFNLGTAGATSTFFLNIFPVIGYHFSLGGAASNLQLSFDGGPIFNITPSPFEFQLNPISPLMGASLHYFF